MFPTYYTVNFLILNHKGSQAVRMDTFILTIASFDEVGSDSQVFEVRFVVNGICFELI